MNSFGRSLIRWIDFSKASRQTTLPWRPCEPSEKRTNYENDPMYFSGAAASL